MITHLFTKLERVIMTILQPVVYVDELCDAVLSHIICMLLGLVPAHGRGDSKQPHGEGLGGKRASSCAVNAKDEIDQ